MMDFHPLTVREVRRETDDAVSIAFDVPEALRPTFRFLPGQYLTLRTEIAGEDVRRTYSICSGPGEPLRVAVKHVPNGRFSTFANRALEPGTVLQVLPPMGRFTVPAEPARPRHHVAFAAGSGITPILALVKALLGEEPKSRVTLCYGNRSVSSILFRDALCDLKDRYVDRFSVHHFLSRQPHEIPLYDGRLDAERLLDTLIPPDRIDTAMICGPGTMIDATTAALRARGIDESAIRVERFGSRAWTPPESSAPETGGIPVTIRIDGMTHTVHVRTAETVLDAAARAGLDVPYACRGGVCATCRAKVTDGKVAMDVNYALAPWEVDAGFTLTCQARPRGPVVIDFDQT